MVLAEFTATPVATQHGETRRVVTPTFQKLYERSVRLTFQLIARALKLICTLGVAFLSCETAAAASCETVVEGRGPRALVSGRVARAGPPSRLRCFHWDQGE